MSYLKKILTRNVSRKFNTGNKHFDFEHKTLF